MHAMLTSPTMVDSNGQACSSMQRRSTKPLFKWLSQTELDEALNTPLPSRPPPARLPPISPGPGPQMPATPVSATSLAALRRRSKLGSPPYFDALTRSTMPVATASSVPKPPPILLARGQDTSMDTLRRVQTRSFSLSDSDNSSQPPSPRSPTSQTTTTTSAWWFQPTLPRPLLLSSPDQPSTPPSVPKPKKYLSPKNPIVFCHGLLGFDSVTIGPAIAPLQVTHWRGIKEVLEENGCEVLITRVPATSSPMDRAKVLEETISAKYPGRSVHLIGHSMGGLDCRYLTTHLEHRQFQVLSVTTIATPHRGSPFATTFLSTIGESRLPSVLSLLAMLPNGGGDGKAFECLTIESMRKFNEETPDMDGVRYFSWGATYEPGLIDTWKWPHSVILEKEGHNDGLVSVESAKWGTYLGTLHGVNHLDLVGWINTARYKWAEMMGKEIKFRPDTFYLGVADMLAREVEGQKGDDEEETEAHEKRSKMERKNSQEEREQMLESLGKAGAEITNEGQSSGKAEATDDEHGRQHAVTTSASDPPSRRTSVKKDGRRTSSRPPSGHDRKLSSSATVVAASTSSSSSKRDSQRRQSKLELLPPTPKSDETHDKEMELAPPAFNSDKKGKQEPKLELLPDTP